MSHNVIRIWVITLPPIAGTVPVRRGRQSNFGSRSLVTKKRQSIFLISIQRSYVTAMNSTATLMSMIQ